MGMRRKFCVTAPNNPEAIAPDPNNWELIELSKYGSAYYMHVRYPNCTNFEGEKLLVFMGPCPDPLPTTLDPHFEEDKPALLARFAPTETGKIQAKTLAQTFHAQNLTRWDDVAKELVSIL